MKKDGKLLWQGWLRKEEAVPSGHKEGGEKLVYVTGAYRVLQNVQMGWVSFPSVCFILVPFLCSFPAFMLCPLENVLQLSVDNWAVGFSVRQRARQEQEQLPDRRDVPGPLSWVAAHAEWEVGGVGSRQPLIKQLPRKPSGQGFLAGLPVIWDLGKDVSRAVLFLNTAIWSRFTDWHGRVMYAGGRSCYNSQR